MVRMNGEDMCNNSISNDHHPHPLPHPPDHHQSQQWDNSNNNVNKTSDANENNNTITTTNNRNPEDANRPTAMIQPTTSGNTMIPEGCNFSNHVIQESAHASQNGHSNLLNHSEFSFPVTCKNESNITNHNIFSANSTIKSDSQNVSPSSGNTFKVPELIVNSNNPSFGNHRSSSPLSPSIPCRKQSVFVAPAELDWIIQKNRINPHLQPQQHLLSSEHHRTDSSGVTITSSYPSSLPSTSSSYYPSSSPSTFPVLNSSSSSSQSSIAPTSLGLKAANKPEPTLTIHSNPPPITVSNHNYPNGTSSSFARKTSLGLQPNANAQEIKEHISKIISENAAIVETLDPLWSRKYPSRHSVSSTPSGSTYPTNLSLNSYNKNSNAHSLPSRRYSEIVVDPNHAAGSKLQSALLGRILTTSSLTSGTTVVTPSNVPHNNNVIIGHQQNLTSLPMKQKSPAKKFSEPNYPSVIINMKQQSLQSSLINPTGALHGTGLEPSLVRNLLTSTKSSSPVKIISVPVSSPSSSIGTCNSSPPVVDLTSNPSSLTRNGSITSSPPPPPPTVPLISIVDASINPDNPEGSIIKDLLLKARDSGENMERRSSRLSQPLSSIPPIQEELSMLVYVCTLCKIAFRNKETLEAHQQHYCKATETRTTNELSPNQLQLLNDHVQRKISVMESNFLQQQLTKPVQSTSIQLIKSNNSIFSQPQHPGFIGQQQNAHAMNKHYQSTAPANPSSPSPSVGNILKQQLLAPTAGPPIKKRKTSEPLFPKHRYNPPAAHPQQHAQLYPQQSHSNLASQFARKISVVQGPSSSLSYTTVTQSKTSNPISMREGLIESDYLNSGLSSSSSSSFSSNSSTSSSLSPMINERSAISAFNEPVTFLPTNTIVTHTIAFSTSNQPHGFVNQSSLDRSSSSSPPPPPTTTTSTPTATSLAVVANQESLDILPDYHPHIKYPKTKVTLSGPIVFPVLRKILVENKENIEFQASSEATQSSSAPLSPSCSSATTNNPSGHLINDPLNDVDNSSYLVYKQIPSIPEFDEDQMLDEKVDSVHGVNSNDPDQSPTINKIGSADNAIRLESSVSMSDPLNNHDHEDMADDDNVDEELLDDDINRGESHREATPNNPNGGDNDIDIDDKEQDENQPEMGLKAEDDDEEERRRKISSPHGNSETLRMEMSKGLTNITNQSNNRPTSLTLRKRFSPSNSLSVAPNKLISSTLASPDTPRPKRKCMQTYIKGQTYTYLGLKMSTRSTYCCIYRPQPMYVPQEASSKLSMYSNWQIISPHDDIFKLLTPSELLHGYDTRQWYFKQSGVKITFAPSLESRKTLADSFILTPSTYWTGKRLAEEQAAVQRDLLELKRKGIDDLMDTNNNNKCLSLPGIEGNVGSLTVPSAASSRKTSEDRLSRCDSDSNDPNHLMKRVKIFEGGFKSNEDYTYVRGRGRGKYVCDECGIRCKKPSMLKKHIRTHTDLRPYSCRHCAFAFKTKGNLTKHMKSKAHHKKCVELGIIPVPITIDDSQIDCEALAKQEALERSYSGGHLASDDDENEDEDGCEEEEEDNSDDEGVPIPIIATSPAIEPLSTDVSNDSEVEYNLQRRYSMSAIQDRHYDHFYNGYEGPIDLTRRHEDYDSPMAGPSRVQDQPPPGRRNTLSTPSATPHHLSRAELAATLNGGSSATRSPAYGIITRDDGKSVCLKCNKSFPQWSQLRLHVNAHALERPYKCDSCGVSFRTKGHLQKHEKSVTHSDKLKINLTFGAPTTDNPRPFKCDDCIIAFRIHGHLAKHLRSKNHIMKLECAGKLPCGMYSDMERFGINLNVIDTADCENSLISLQKLAEKMYSKNGEIDLTWLKESSTSYINNNSDHPPPHHLTVANMDCSTINSISTMSTMSSNPNNNHHNSLIATATTTTSAPSPLNAIPLMAIAPSPINTPATFTSSPILTTASPSPYTTTTTTSTATTSTSASTPSTSISTSNSNNNSANKTIVERHWKKMITLQMCHS